MYTAKLIRLTFARLQFLMFHKNNNYNQDGIIKVNYNINPILPITLCYIIDFILI